MIRDYDVKAMPVITEFYFDPKAPSSFLGSPEQWIGSELKNAIDMATSWIKSHLLSSLNQFIIFTNYTDIKHIGGITLLKTDNKDWESIGVFRTGFRGVCYVVVGKKYDDKVLTIACSHDEFYVNGEFVNPKLVDGCYKINVVGD